MKKYSLKHLLLFLNNFVKIILILLFSSCWLNPNAPANIIECNKGNIQGESLKDCKKDVKNLFQMIALAIFGRGNPSTITVENTKYVYTGNLTDSDGKPLANASIKSEPSGLEGTTDANGNFQFTGSPGTYIATANKADGTEAGSFEVNVPQGGGQVTVFGRGLER